MKKLVLTLVVALCAFVSQAQTKSEPLPVTEVTVENLKELQPYAHYILVIEDEEEIVAPMLLQCSQWANYGSVYGCGWAVCQDQSQSCSNCGPWIETEFGLVQGGCFQYRTITIY